MRTMKYAVVAGLGMLVATSCAVMAEGGAAAANPDKPKKEKVEVVLQDLKLEGIVAKVEKQTKDGKTAVGYELTTADGQKVRLPAAKPKKNEAPAYNLDEFAGANVAVSGKGVQQPGRNGKVKTQLKQIVSIEKVGAAPAAAP